VAPGRPLYSSAGQASTDDRGIYRLGRVAPGDYLVVVQQTPATLPASFVNSAIQSVAGGLPAAGLFDMMSAGVAPTLSGIRVGDLILSSGGVAGPPPGLDGHITIYQTLFYPASATPAQASILTLHSGETRTGVDFQLRLVTTARVSGTVTLPAGSPGGLPVRLVATASDNPANNADIDVAVAVTAADGAFTFLAVPPGDYTAEAEKRPPPPIPPELASNPMVQMALGDRSGQPTVPLFARAHVSVGAADVTGLALALDEGAHVSGRVQFEGSQPPQPLPPSLRVILTSAGMGRSTAAGGAAAGVIDARGQFTTAGYPPGRYFLSVVGRIGGDWVLKSIKVPGGEDALDVPITLENASLDGFVVTYSNAMAQIAGTVHSSAGAKASDASVLIFPADYRAWMASGMSPRRMRTAPVGANGGYLFDSMPAGDYLVAAVDDADVTDDRDEAFFDAVSRVAERVTIVDGEHKTVDLTAARVPR
jgi:hypothetical protein